MSQSAIIFPALCQAVLTLVILIVMGWARARSMRALSQKIDDSDVRLGQNTWTEEATKVSNNYKNQYEVPVLFYAVVGLALALKLADPLMIGLAWVFALTRVVHSILHIGPNSVPSRGLFFLIGVVAVLAMWLVLGWRVATGV